MAGPYEDTFFALSESEEPALLWITALSANVVDIDGKHAEAQEFFCHSNLLFDARAFDAKARSKRFGNTMQQDRKLFTLMQGEPEIRFPDGFGIPILSDEPLQYHTRVLNPAMKAEPVRVQIHSTIEYVRDSELARPFKPLIKLAWGARVPVEPVDGLESAGTAAEHLIEKHEMGYRQTGMWYVPPGRHTYRYRIERRQFQIPFDTTVHYITAHLHPYGESVELRDLTTDETLFISRATQSREGIALERLEEFSSEGGLPVHRDHDYEIAAVYNNTTDHNVDAMAVIYLHLYDKAFEAKNIRLSVSP